ncbi:MAG: insulinase family protein [Candidatus Wildermuthbacteria bacterium]|nr:insulinase family protein [Candidatus Wildermuthbacteria bacterium]
MITFTKFPNGLRFLAIPDKNAQTATALALVGTGSKYEERSASGISHFLEHMFFKGTRKRPTPLAVAESLDRIGGAFNAFTGEDYTGYYAKVNKEHFDLALEWVSDIFLHSLLPAPELEKEKGVVIEEINMYRDNPASHVQSLWTKVLYGDQPAGWDIAGTKETVSRLTRVALASYMKSQYVASNTVVALSGNIDVEKAKRKTSALFRSIPVSSFRVKQQVAENQKNPQTLVEFRKTDQTHFVLGTRAFGLLDSRRYAQAVLATALGGMMSSRLFVKIREQLGLAYYVSTTSETTPETGYVATSAGVRNGEAAMAVKEIIKEYQALKTRLIPLSELQKAKDNLLGKLAIGLEASDTRASFHAMQELLERKISTLDAVYDRIKKVRSSDLRRLAQEIFRPDRLNLALLGPFEDGKQFETLLSR